MAFKTYVNASMSSRELAALGFARRATTGDGTGEESLHREQKYNQQTQWDLAGGVQKNYSCTNSLRYHPREHREGRFHTLTAVHIQIVSARRLADSETISEI